jgi:glutaconyl-CoA/methylmalonyl-CoA decarboxylase subunit gamma
MKKFKFNLNDKQYDASVISFEENTVKIDVNGIVYNVKVDKKIEQQKTPTLVRTKTEPSTESHKATAKTSSPTEKKGAGVIKAPLPGTIIKVLVNVGDYVKPGMKLLTWEAMKMENNLTADREGTIKSIKVKAGDTILEGDTLIEIE